MRQRVLIIVGVAVAVLALYTVLFGARPSGQLLSSVGAAAAGALAESSEESGAQGEEQPAAAGKTGAAAGEKPAEKQPEAWGTDPFVRDWLMVNELAGFNLMATSMGGEKPYALINNQILEEGDQISGKTIVRIEADKVILAQGERTFALMLGE